MGLDLMLYTAKEKHADIEDWKKLAYGRKTWGIAHFFMYRCKKNEEDWDYRFEVPEIAWEEFMENVTPYFENEHFLKMVEEYDEYEEKPGVSWQIEDLFERFLDCALEDDSPYTLGPAWEARAVLGWYQADKEVREIYANGEKVFLDVSY